MCMCRLVGAFTARQFNKNHHHMCWQIHRNNISVQKTFHCGSLIYFLVQKRMWIVYTSSLQCYSVLSDILVKNELCIPLERGSNDLSTGEGFICLSPPSKLKSLCFFCSIYKKTISFSVLSDFHPMAYDDNVTWLAEFSVILFYLLKVTYLGEIAKNCSYLPYINLDFLNWSCLCVLWQTDGYIGCF